MTLKAKILKRAAWDYEAVYAYKQKCRPNSAIIRGAEWQHNQLAPLLEALAECADALTRTYHGHQMKEDCPICQDLINLERLLKDEVGE
jgi:hypothetical protein